MMNQVVILGRICKDIQIEKEGDKEFATVTLAVQRSYKNEEGEYETDFIDATLVGGVATQTAEYCRKGDLIGIKGRLESSLMGCKLIAEKVTFLSSGKPEEN